MFEYDENGWIVKIDGMTVDEFFADCEELIEELENKYSLK